MKNIVIVGGGAGGLELATHLGQKLGKREKAQIILVDKNPSHLWKPLLHEIATGVLDDNMDDVNYLAQAKRNRFQFKQGALLDVDRDNKYIVLDETKNTDGEVIFPKTQLNYDLLVIAIGSQCNDFGTPGVKENCIFLEDAHRAKQFRETMLTRLFRLSAGLNTENESKLRVAIVGGGATGVELASELFAMIEKLSAYGFHGMTPDRLNVTLIEAADRILPVLTEKLSHSIHQKLTHYGVNVLTQTMITQANEKGFYTKTNDIIEADIMVWAAGIKAPDFLQNIGSLETTRSNQLLVMPTLQTTRDKTIFVIGDCAACPKPKGGMTPPTAQAAHQMAKLCASNIIAYLDGAPLRSFRYKDKGTIISLAHTAQGSVTTVGDTQMIVKGAPAYLIYRLLYRMHQSALYGMIKTARLILAGRVFRTVRPTLKLD